MGGHAIQYRTRKRGTMIIKICDRCGKRVGEGQRTLNGIEICGECAADFEEFMQGAAVLKWNPIKVKEITDEERDEMIENGYTPEQLEELTMLDGFTPEDGQEILITCKARSGRLFVEYDEAVSDGDGDCWLDSGRDWEDVTAWAAKPKPYEEREKV